MAGLINLGAGLSAMGQSLASSSLEAEKNALDVQKMTLADQLQGKREQANIAAEGANQLANTKLEGQNQQEAIAATGGEQRKTASFTNTLPMTQAEQADIKVRNRQAGAAETSAAASMMEAEKPISGGFTGSFLVRDPSTGKWNVTNSATSGAPIPIDPNSNNLSAQTGLSDKAIKAATGEISGRYAAPYLDELQAWGVKNGINVDTIKAQAKAANNVLQNNIQRNNQGTILENEIQGSVGNLAPMLDAAKRGDIRFVNSAEGWVAQQANDPQATQIADQINRFRGEIAGYNAVAGGHLMENGTPHPDPGDFAAADRLISNGVNSGSVKALADSIAQSAAKNKAVLLNSIDEANKNFFSLFGAKYHTTPQGAGAAAAGGAGAGSGQKVAPMPEQKDRVVGKTTWTNPHGVTMTWTKDGWAPQ